MTDSKYYVQALTDLSYLIHRHNVLMGWYDADKVRPFDGMLMNVVTEVAEAQEEWRKGRGINEYHWSITITPGNPGPELRTDMGGRLYIKNYDWDFDNSVPKVVPEWLPVTSDTLRSMPNMIKYLKPEGIPAELADIIIRVLDICGANGIDIARALADKMAYNETRDYRHGGKLS